LSLFQRSKPFSISQVARRELSTDGAWRRE
jgi:hypothetical protein